MNNVQFMGRRSDHTSEEIKGMLVQAAFDLVDQKGVKAFNARTITKSIGYSVGTLYNFFEGMEELMLYVNLKTLVMLFDKIKKKIPPIKNSKELGAKISHEYLLFAKKHEGLWILLYETQIPKRPLWYQEGVDSKFAEIETLLAPFIGKEIKKGCQILWGALHGICLLELRGKLEPKNAEMLCSEFFEAFLKGYR